MGAEYLVIASAILGAFASLALVFLSFQKATRPYAFPTLIFSCAIGVWSTLGKSTNFHLHFAIGFLIGAIVLGLHAKAIKTLVEWRSAASPSPSKE